MAGFQRVVNQYMSPAVEGDFADHSIRTQQLASEGQLVANANGTTIARFAWFLDGQVYNAGTIAPAGFIHREQQALITDYLGSDSMLIPAGTPVTILTQGSFWARTATEATIGQKVFASTTDGSVATGAAGATVDGYVETQFYVGSAGAAEELIQIGSWIYGVNGTGE